MTDDVQLIDLAKRIAAAKRGEGPMPSNDELRAQIDAIRLKRTEYRQTSSRATKATAAAATGAKATIEKIDLDKLGI